MSDILIKGMEMPNVCAYCFIDSSECNLHSSVNIWRERHPDCQLIELPPHGRLGDLGKLWDRMYNYIDNEGAKMPFGDNDFMIRITISTTREQRCHLAITIL